jgi:phosphotransferase system  glucose/maltose/N-acetylglucosamine-specific IIC component
VVLLIAVGLSFPFWGDRPGYERSWFNWGFVIALVYIAVAGTFVYFMVRLYGTHLGGRLDSDKTAEQTSAHADAQDHDKGAGR